MNHKIFVIVIVVVLLLGGLEAVLLRGKLTYTERFEILNTQRDNLRPASSADSDKDGLSNIVEEIIGTDPFSADTDGDGMVDLQEIIHGRNPSGAGGLFLDMVAGNSSISNLVMNGHLVPNPNALIELDKPLSIGQFLRFYFNMVELNVPDRADIQYMRELAAQSNIVDSIDDLREVLTGEMLESILGKHVIYRGELNRNEILEVLSGVFVPKTGFINNILRYRKATSSKPNPARILQRPGTY